MVQVFSCKNAQFLWILKGEITEEYGIRSYPSALFYGDGSLAKTHVEGYMSKEGIEKTLKIK